MKRYWLGFLAIAPTFGCIIPFVYIIRLASVLNTDRIPTEQSGIFFTMMAVLFISVCATMVQIIAYIFMVVKNMELQISQKVAWAVCLWFFSIFLIPVYWYLYVGKTDNGLIKSK